MSGNLLLSAAKKLHVRSALNPLLWLVAICGSFVPMARLFSDTPWIQTVLIITLLLVIFFTLCAYGFFALKSPEKLQSEEYQIRHESLQLIQTKSGYIPLNPTNLDAIANPVLKQLPQGDKE